MQVNIKFRTALITFTLIVSSLSFFASDLAVPRAAGGAGRRPRPRVGHPGRRRAPRLCHRHRDYRRGQGGSGTAVAVGSPEKR